MLNKWFAEEIGERLEFVKEKEEFLRDLEIKSLQQELSLLHNTTADPKQNHRMTNREKEPQDSALKGQYAFIAQLTFK